ncbi:VOC family protein [Promicromonospora sukumoe]|uniref:PhnB protein n=1 Tax=Promicromonospora sukumoe TaxID=88382 RepID=A0A7W3JCQ8_9MICO|nr:VOC family protein [Promicromonospora sukumoe]MBA8810436.1 PhnB protein [Promicromonospora sukumoe]
MAKLNPYLSFKSEAKDALDFYRSVLGGELAVSTFGENPMEGMPTPDEDKDLVMHGQLDAPGGLTIMAADTPSFMEYVAPTSGVTVSLTGGPDDHEYIKGAYEKLSDGATPGQALELAPWGDYYGALTDKFGISWMFDIGTEQSGR